MTNLRVGLAVVLAFVALVWFAFARPDRSPGPTRDELVELLQPRRERRGGAVALSRAGS